MIESELNTVLEQDNRYWRENDAKFRAVAQNASYEQFQEIVAASHLKPLSKSDKMQPNTISSSATWNCVANNRSVLNYKTEDTNNPSLLIKKNISSPKTINEFRDILNSLDAKSRFEFMYKLGTGNLAQIFTSEIPSQLFASIIKTLLLEHFDADYLMFSIKTVEILVSSKRFSLCYQFLSETEKLQCLQLIDKLQSASQELDIVEKNKILLTINNISKFLVEQ